MLRPTALTWLLCLTTAGLPDDALLAQAEKAFHAGLRDRGKPVAARKHFRKAAALYAQLASHGVHNAPLYRNLGNASLLGGDLAGAVLAYRRGLRLTPDDPDLRAGLQGARERVADATVGSFGAPPEPFLPPWMPVFSERYLLALTFVLYVAACIVWTRWRMTRRAGLAWGFLLIVILCASSLSVVVLLLRQTHWEGEHPLVVIAAEKVYLHQGDGSSYPRYSAAVRQWTDSGLDTDASALPAGVEARLLFERGDWLQIRLEGGEVGWIPRGAAVVDRPVG